MLRDDADEFGRATRGVEGADVAAADGAGESGHDRVGRLAVVNEDEAVKVADLLSKAEPVLLVVDDEVELRERDLADVGVLEVEDILRHVPVPDAGEGEFGAVGQRGEGQRGLSRVQGATI